MSGLGGAAMLFKSIVGAETFDQIQGLANDGTLAKIVSFAENGEALTQAVKRLEQKLDDFIASFDEPVHAVAAIPAVVGTAIADTAANGPAFEHDPGAGRIETGSAAAADGERVPDGSAAIEQPGSGEPSSGDADGSSSGAGTESDSAGKLPLLGKWGL